MISFHESVFSCGEALTGPRRSSATAERTIKLLGPVTFFSPRHSGFLFCHSMLDLETVQTAYAVKHQVARGLDAVRQSNYEARNHNRQLFLNTRELPLAERQAARREGEKPLAQVGREALPDWVRSTFKEENEARSRLNQRDGPAWRAACMRLPPLLRGAVASIVWWDFFSIRGGEPGMRYRAPWSDLDDLIQDKPPMLEPARIERGLVRVGYTPWHAHKRMIAQ